MREHRPCATESFCKNRTGLPPGVWGMRERGRERERERGEEGDVVSPNV